ncbi:MAG TPA: histidine phosphatase family protein [Acidobacteriaceae bacterium]|nr:histidine phosphatase family protein [Acidobacteriaceae bacterium]
MHDPNALSQVPTHSADVAAQELGLSAAGLPTEKSAPAMTYFAHPNRAGLDVFLMRHASAGTRRVNPKLDVKRPLDKDGKRLCLQLAQVLSGLRISFDLIVSSPLKRCLQTAQLVGTEMGYEAKILHAQALEPGADFTQFQRLLHECRSYESVLMVGHNPNMTAFLGQLIAASSDGEHRGGMANVRLRKGSLARVTVERGPAVLKWLLDPRIVRSLYATSTKSSRRKTSRK